MNRLVCEMCNSTDIVKEVEFFVCQHCGCKYTVEAAKKMMIEGRVDVSGSVVTINNQPEIDNLFLLARRAAQENNIASATEYYTKLYQFLPNNWEAYFYNNYYKQLNARGSAFDEGLKKMGHWHQVSIDLLWKDSTYTNEQKNQICYDLDIRLLDYYVYSFRDTVNRYNRNPWGISSGAANRITTLLDILLTNADRHMNYWKDPNRAISIYRVIWETSNFNIANAYIQQVDFVDKKLCELDVVYANMPITDRFPNAQIRNRIINMR